MHIIVQPSDSDRSALMEKYQNQLLELDRFYLEDTDTYLTGWCVLTPEYIMQNISDIYLLPHYMSMHQKLIDNYRSKNWNFSEQMIEQLLDKFGPDMNTFYLDLQQRVLHNKKMNDEEASSWSDIIIRKTVGEVSK